MNTAFDDFALEAEFFVDDGEDSLAEILTIVCESFGSRASFLTDRDAP